DTDRRTEIDDRLLASVREVVAVDEQRHALAGHAVRCALCRINDLERGSSADCQPLRTALNVRSREAAEIHADVRRSRSRAGRDDHPNDVVLVAEGHTPALPLLGPP